MTTYFFPKNKKKRLKIKETICGHGSFRKKTQTTVWTPKSESGVSVNDSQPQFQYKEMRHELRTVDPVTNEFKTTVSYSTIKVPLSNAEQELTHPAQFQVTSHHHNIRDSETISVPSHNESFPHPPAPNNDHESSSGTHHARRQKKLSDAWSTVKPTLKEAYIKTCAPATFTCSLCDREDPNIIFCADCGPFAYYCEQCTMKIHVIATFHVPVRWLGNTYVPHMWYKEVNVPNHHCTSQTIPSVLAMIDDKGRQHQTVVHFCGCMSKPETLLRLGFWPGSPVNPTTAIDIRFMNQARSFMLEGTQALQSFCACIKDYLSTLIIYEPQVDLYRVLVQECSAQFRSFAYDVEHLDGIVPNFPDGSECPLCEKTQDTLPKLISLDANFRLVRKKSSGVSHAPPHHGSKFFVEKDEITPFLSKESSTASANNNACSDFRAGDAKKSAFKAPKLDVTGLFGSVCVHDYPQLFIDLDGGEKLGYAACLISKWNSATAGLNITYDIACRLKPYLQRVGIDVNAIGLAVPVFHGYAHEAKCQVNYNPRLLKHYRNADGENVERMWSYLGEFAYITKEMTSSNRRDLIVDALLHYGQKNIKSATLRMKSRVENARAEKHEAWVELDKAKGVLRDGGWIINDETILTWSSEYRKKIEDRSKKFTGTTWEEDYATTLNTFYSLSARLVLPAIGRDEVERQTEIDRLEQRLEKIEASHKIQRWASNNQLFMTFLDGAHQKRSEDFLKRLHREAVERRHLILIKKDARGHDTAARVSKQIKTTNLRIHKLLGQYNKMKTDNQLSFDDVKDTDSAIYQDIETLDDTNIPYNLMREVVMASNRIERCNEELKALKYEFYGLLEYYRELHHLLEASLNSDTHGAGAKALLLKYLFDNEHQQELIVSAIRKFIEPDQHNITAQSQYLKEIERECRSKSHFSDTAMNLIQEDEASEDGITCNSDNDDVDTSDEEIDLL